MAFKVYFNNILNYHLENDITYIYVPDYYRICTCINRIHKIYDIKILFIYKSKIICKLYIKYMILNNIYI